MVSRDEWNIADISESSGLQSLFLAYKKSYKEVVGAVKQYSEEHLVRRCEELLRHVEVEGKNVLEVGAGDGFLSNYMLSVKGAQRVVSLDEYCGNGSSMDNYKINSRLKSILDRSGRLDVVRADFVEYNTDETFDVIVFANVVHHIICTSHLLSQDNDEFGAASGLFLKCKNMLRPEGVLLMQESGRSNYCPIPRYRKMMASTHRRTKQPEKEWSRAMKAAGFKELKIRYRLPLNLPDSDFLRLLFCNRAGSLLTDSSYFLIATN